MSYMKHVLASMVIFILVLTHLSFGDMSGLGDANQKHVEIAKQFLKEKLGEEYYSQFLNFTRSDPVEYCDRSLQRTIDKCTLKNSILFDYNLPLNLTEDYYDPAFDGTLNGYLLTHNRVPSNVTEASFPVFYDSIWRDEYIRVIIDNNGTVVKYEGPSKPYLFLISKKNATSIAKSYGIKDIRAIGLTQSFEKTGDIGWTISSNETLKCGTLSSSSKGTEIAKRSCDYRGLFIDADNGSIKEGVILEGSKFSEGNNLTPYESEGIDSKYFFLFMIVLIIAVILYKYGKKIRPHDFEK